MKKFEDTKVKTPVEIICDCCGRKAKIDDDDYESQEFVSIDFVGGYKSIFGDGTQVSLDICQYCLKDKFGKFIKTIGYSMQHLSAHEKR